MTVPAKWQSISKMAGLPKHVVEAFKEYGRLEGAGAADNPTIINWADEVNLTTKTAYSKWAADWYNKDSIAWCGLFMALIMCRSINGTPNAAKRLPPLHYLSALAWAEFGDGVQFKGREGYRLNEILLGDIAVFVRSGGGHVATIIGVSTNGKTVFVIGGNQSNMVNITEISVDRLYAVRRIPYVTRPAGARHIRINSTGVISNNEA